MQFSPNDLQFYIALTQIQRVGSVAAKNLLRAFGEPQSVFKAQMRHLQQVEGIGQETARHIANERDAALLRAEQELNFAEREGIRILSFLDPDYPQRLLAYDDAPLVLYYKGNASLNARRTVSIVGTRSPSDYGKRNCKRLVEELKSYNPIIVSGLALGVDIEAHETALDAGLPTIGVVAHGLDRIYPYRHRQTAQAMLENGGLLTEFVSQTAPLQQNFPMRNRIIAGLCDALVVVESGRSGGSMISAYFANEYQKDVFALPGRTDDERSAGCNLLIKTHRAALLESAEDIAYLLRWEKKPSAEGRKAEPKPIFVQLSEEEKQIAELLCTQPERGLHLDQLLSALRLPTHKLAVLLLDMELKGLLRAMPGKHFVWTASQ